jgi:hypothetical protein
MDVVIIGTDVGRYQRKCDSDSAIIHRTCSPLCGVTIQAFWM